MKDNPIHVIDNTPMSIRQVIAVAVAVLLNGLDGFDVVAISFSAPEIADVWNVSAASLGIILSTELIGMALGSITIGSSADTYGRRSVILFCLFLMTIGMLASALSINIATLLVSRLLTGLGIGGMLAAIATAAAEHSNIKNRSFSVALQAIGYPAMAVIGGSISAYLLKYYDWRSVFFLGTLLSIVLIPITWLGMPETILFLAQKQPDNALEKINHQFRKMGKPLVSALPVPNTRKSKSALGELFTIKLWKITLISALAYFFHAFTFYFLLKWLPKIATGFGLTASEGAYTLVISNIGGTLGGIIFGFLFRYMELKKLTLLILLLSFISVAIFGQVSGDFTTVSLLGFVAGFFSNAGIVALYSLATHIFPTESRSSGTGFMIGIGRAGSVLSPILIGFLFNAGIPLQSVALIAGLGSLLAFMMISLLYWADKSC